MEDFTNSWNYVFPFHWNFIPTNYLWPPQEWKTYVINDKILGKWDSMLVNRWKAAKFIRKKYNEVSQALWMFDVISRTLRTLHLFSVLIQALKWRLLIMRSVTATVSNHEKNFPIFRLQNFLTKISSQTENIRSPPKLFTQTQSGLKLTLKIFSSFFQQ